MFCECKSDCCSCVEDYSICDWKWDDKHLFRSVTLSENKRDVYFHQTFSSGTGAVRGDVPFRENFHYYWEIKMLSPLYGTDIMVGVGTENVEMDSRPFRFCSFLGLDQESWGYSYRGNIQCDGQKYFYGPTFNEGTIIGVHLDMCNGILRYYYNRRPLDIAFTGLKNRQLYPIVCSTAAQSSMRIVCAISMPPTLQLLTIENMLRMDRIRELTKIPGLLNLLSKQFWWLISYSLRDKITPPLPEPDDTQLIDDDYDTVNGSYFIPDDVDDSDSDLENSKRTKYDDNENIRLSDGPTSVRLLHASYPDHKIVPCESCGIERFVFRGNHNRLCYYCDLIL